jgi:Ca2+-binding EF-hand superfamily protein
VNRHLSIAIVIACCCLNSFAADNQFPGSADQAKAAEAAKQQVLRQFDLNRDGVLSPQEQLRAQEALRKSGFPIMPGGSIAAAPELKQFDRDGDGKLNPQEQRAAQEAWNRSRGNGSGPARGGFPGGNGNAGNGVPTAPASAPAAEPKPEKVSPLVKRYDKDGDGKLNDDEKAAAQADRTKGKKKEKPEKAKEPAGKDDKAKEQGDKPAEKADKP